MDNLFDVDNYPEIEPSSVVKGSLWTWKRSDLSGVYNPTAYDLQYKFSNRDDGSEFTITAGVIDNIFVVEAEVSDQVEAMVGYCQYNTFIVRKSDSKKIQIFEGFMDIEAETSGESYAYATLKAIRATIQKTASKEQQAYSVAGRSLSRRTVQELLELELEFQKRVENERTEANRNAGKPSRSMNTSIRMIV